MQKIKSGLNKYNYCFKKFFAYVLLFDLVDFQITVNGSEC